MPGVRIGAVRRYEQRGSRMRFEGLRYTSLWPHGASSAASVPFYSDEFNGS